MNWIDKLRQKTEQLKKKIKRRVKSIKTLIKRNPKYILVNILKYIVLRLLWIVIYIFCAIINLPIDSLIRNIIDGKIFEWLKDFVANIDFKKIISFLQNVSSNFRQIITGIAEFIYKRFKDLKRVLVELRRMKHIFARIKMFLIRNLSKIKRIIKSVIGGISGFIFVKLCMLFIIPFLGIRIIFAGKDISIVATMILCGIFSWVGTYLGKLIGDKGIKYFLSKISLRR
ncbi:hypothetical protein [Megamonas hypermegale]|uniref:hypothetical protein n=1 Tax=Megamonas hypermegale TaxID=158847 RepID=UPI0026F1E433|nr:hypothetical protein [Megamonas hypermegale]